MLGTLLKKQLCEIFRGFFYDRKNGKARSAASSVAFIALYAFLIIFVIGGMFGSAALSVCGHMFSAGFGWLYYAMFAVAALAFGVFGSVFSTYSGLYLAKDNDLLLSMPIPIYCIIISRLLGVYLVGLMFSGAALVPALCVAFMFAKPGASAVLGAVVLIAAVSLITLFISCLLGWLVARISLKLKNKSSVTVIISVVFLAAYYLVYFRAQEIMGKIIANTEMLGERVKGAAYPLYLLGRAGEGNLGAVLVVVLSVVIFGAAVYFLLERNFIGMASSAGVSRKTKSGKIKFRSKSTYRTLFEKELSRFTSSANYMLNCGLGTLFLLVGAGFILIKGKEISALLSEIFGRGGFEEILVIASVSLLAMSNVITAPSVSLEGKNLWIIQSLPVGAWDILRTKIMLHVAVGGVPTLICGLCAAGVFAESSPVMRFFMVLVPLQCVILCAFFGLYLNLKSPNLTWVNEVVPIKQSFGVMMTLFGGWIYAVLIAIVYYAVCGFLSAEIFMTAASAFTALVTLLLFLYMRKRGAEAFSNL